MKKRAQARIQEMIFMILGVFLFFVIVLLFYLSITLAGLKDDVSAIKRAGNVLLVFKLTENPEFSCTDPDNTVCVDADKLIALKENKHYQNFWRVDGLKVEKMMVNSSSLRECIYANYPVCSTFTIVPIKPNSIADSTFVSLCRKEIKNGYTYDMCEPARITVYTQQS